MADIRQLLCDPPAFGDGGLPDGTPRALRAEPAGFRQGAEDRDRTRPAYRRTGTAWTKELLWP
ncbi:hypothetical protein ACH4YO_03010 [Streptomyces noursei]|uniref:hypothetical protein n=1 Tax=Streptomyces noursei TaxID=1971 RepID=UPI0033C2EE12